MDNQIRLQTNIKDDFVGFEYSNKGITIFYPKTFDIFGNDDSHEYLDCKTDKKAIKLLSIFVRSFRLADSKDRFNDSSPNDNDKIDVVDYPIEAYEFMIDDYQRNGRYIEFESVLMRNGNGKIDWKRTLRLNPLIVNCQPYYLETITKQKRIVSSLLNDIYMFCVYESVVKFGSWFYGMNCNSIPSKVRQIKPELKKLYVHTIQTKMNGTFNDDTINRLRNMLMVVNGAKEGNGIQRMGLKSYHSVFEKLIKWGLDNVGNLDKYNPRATWNLEEAENILSPLRMDALRIENHTAYILDAKFYQDTLPGTADINKQITYGENLYTNHKENVNSGLNYKRKNILNFFVLPKPRCEMNDRLIFKTSIVGKAYWRESKHSFESIYLLNVSLLDLLLIWNKNEQQSLLEQFRTQIA